MKLATSFYAALLCITGPRIVGASVIRRLRDVAVRQASVDRRLRGHEARNTPPDPDTLTGETIDQATTHPRNKQFEAVDSDSDGKITPWEYYATTSADQRVAAYRFNCTDTNLDRSLDVDEFTATQSKPQDLDRCVNMHVAFKMVDKNNDGVVSKAELWNNIAEGDHDRDAFLIACSDSNRDGKISPMEFSSDIYGCVEDKSQKAFEQLHDFSKSDTNRNGCVDEAELVVAVHKFLGNDLISDKPPGRTVRRFAQRWMQCADHDLNGCLDRKEYLHVIEEPTPEEEMCMGTSFEQYHADVDFEIMDTSGDGKVSKQEYYDWCSEMDFQIEHEEVEALFNSADSNHDGYIDEAEFAGAGEEHQGDGPGQFMLLRSSHRNASNGTSVAWPRGPREERPGARHEFLARLTRAGASNRTRSKLLGHVRWARAGLVTP